VVIRRPYVITFLLPFVLDGIKVAVLLEAQAIWLRWLVEVESIRDRVGGEDARKIREPRDTASAFGHELAILEKAWAHLKARKTKDQSVDMFPKKWVL
jgi:hypothetical protein